MTLEIKLRKRKKNIYYMDIIIYIYIWYLVYFEEFINMYKYIYNSNH